MKQSVKLPLYNDFLQIFDNHTIKNWQAKHFWKHIGLNQANKTNKYKNSMYIGLRVLVKCGYLEVDRNNSSKKLFSYSETEHLNNLRNIYRKQNLDPIFEVKKTLLLDEIQEKQNNISFLNDLLSDNESLEKYFITYKKNLENDIKNIKSNIRLMDNILNK